MLDLSSLKYPAMLLAWVITMAVGGFWYSPAGFGKAWSKLTKIDLLKMPKNEANSALAFMGLAAVVQVVALCIVLRSVHTVTWIDGLKVGALLWAGFTAATTVGNTLYQRLGWKFWWINASYFLVVMVLDSIVLTVWR